LPFATGPSGLLLALTSGLSWGVADFLGGLGSRRAGLVLALTVIESLGLAIAVAFVALGGEASPPLVAFALATLGGIIGLAGLASLFGALARGMMSLVSPIAAAMGAGLPVIAGWLMGDQLSPSQVAGIACSLAAVVAVSLPRGHIRLAPAELGLAFGAGLGFGSFYVLIQLAVDAGGGPWWTLFGVRLGPTLVVIATVLLLTLRGRPVLHALPASTALILLLGGFFDLGGNLFVLLALPILQLGIAAVLSSLYPVVTIVLAAVVLRERFGRVHATGIVLALVGIVLIAL
jgi:drug/metabolite transporter (DMT)-like permease